MLSVITAHTYLNVPHLPSPHPPCDGAVNFVYYMHIKILYSGIHHGLLSQSQLYAVRTKSLFLK